MTLPKIQTKEATAQIIQMQRQIASLPDDVKEHNDIQDLINSLFRARSALERISLW